MIVRFSLFFGHWIKVDTIEITNANVRIVTVYKKEMTRIYFIHIIM